MEKKLIEAALFIASEPVDMKELSRITGIGSLGTLREELRNLAKEYEGRGIEIVETPKGWAMQVKDELLDRVAHLTPHSDLTGGEKRTLAIIAYKEPVLQAEIIRMQGNKAYSYIKSLQKRELICGERKGHTKMLTLTGKFEEYFGESREKIKEKLASTLKAQEKKAGVKAEVQRTAEESNAAKKTETEEMTDDDEFL